MGCRVFRRALPCSLECPFLSSSSRIPHILRHSVLLASLGGGGGVMFNFPRNNVTVQGKSLFSGRMRRVRTSGLTCEAGTDLHDGCSSCAQLKCLPWAVIFQMFPDPLDFGCPWALLDGMRHSGETATCDGSHCLANSA